MQGINIFQLIAGLSLIYLMPFFIGVVIPAILIPLVIKFILNWKGNKIPSIKPFIFFLILGGFLTEIFWMFFIDNQIYHEWDPGFYEYSFFGYNQPSFGGMGGSWLAPGWKLWQLDLLWYLLTISIYLSAFLLTWWKQRKHPQIKLQRNILTVSVAALISVTFIATLTSLGYPFRFFIPKELKYQENNITCVKSSYGPKIIYHQSGQELTSDLAGQDIKTAFAKDLQIRSHVGSFSFDDSQIALFWDKELWIFCTYTEGAQKIVLPKFGLNDYNDPRSTPFWSPDGKQLVFNDHGDLVTVDEAAKKITVLQKQVALRDNHVDVTAKGYNNKIPAYEIGSAYWAGDGVIYYTSFSNDSVKIHQYNPNDQSDQVIYETKNEVNFKSGDPTGRYLLLNTYLRNPDRTLDTYSDILVVLDTVNKKIVQQKDIDVTVVWSPSGKYVASSQGNWDKKNRIITYAASISQADYSESINATALVENAYTKMGKTYASDSIVVEILDFVDDDRVLLHITFPWVNYSDPIHQANAILNFHTGEMQVLQDYPNGQDTGKELFAIRILH